MSESSGLLEKNGHSDSESERSSAVGPGPSCEERWNRCLAAREPPREECPRLAECVRPDGDMAKLSALVIFFNTGYLWIIQDWSAAPGNFGNPMPAWMRVVDESFLFYYTVEVALKLAVHRWWYFWNDDWGWNLFDFFIVLCGLALLGMSWFASSPGVHIEFLRSIRLLRVTRILRVFKFIGVVQELRQMADCVVGSLMSLVWAVLFLFIMLLAFSIVFVQDMTNFRLDHCMSGDQNPDVCADIPGIFGSVIGGMMTLFMSTTGGTDWGDVYAKVVLTGNSNGVLFVGFIVFFLLCFFNIVTSMFVDKAIKLAKPDENLVMKQKKEEEVQVAGELQALIGKIDEDGSGDICSEELEAAFVDPNVRHNFALLGISVRDAKRFFTTMSAMAGSEHISIDCFVDGCLQLKGGASCIDVQAVGWQVYQLGQQIKMLSENTHNDRNE